MPDPDCDDAEEEQGPLTEERARSLEALAAQTRERLGEREWRRLEGLTLIPHLATIVCGFAVLAAAWLCFSIALLWLAALLERLLWPGSRLPAADLGRYLLYLALAVGVGITFFGAGLVADALLRRSLDRHEQEGEDPDALRQALRADHDIRRIRRKLAEQARLYARLRTDQALLAQEVTTAPSRWRTECSGAYLLWWLSGAFWLSYLVFRWPLPDRALYSIAIVTASGLLFRLILLAVLRGPRQNPSERRSSLRFYWWWARGWLPAAVALLPGVAYWLVARSLRWG